MTNRKVSILMPTCNRADLLKRAINSVLSQSFSDWELIVVNDASADATKAFLDRIAAKDSRIRPIHHEKNYYPDISRTLNEAMALAQGVYIARLDDDDYWCDPDKLKKQVVFLDSYPDHVITGGGTIVIDETDHEIFRYQKLETDAEIRDKALFANPFTHSTILFRKEVALMVGGYGAFDNAEDWELWLKLGMHGKFHNFQEYFVRYLMTETSKTFIFKRSQSREILKIISLHRREYPNFIPAYALNAGQYIYSLLPYSLRKSMYSFLAKSKRALFSSS